MSLGSTIKSLRRANNLTQEDLAEYLGVSSKAVSQWECDRTAPDISLLAPLASVFDVTTDNLLGIDIGSKSKQIDMLYDEAYTIACNGDHKQAIALIEKALMLHPSSYKLMDFYANEIFLYNGIFPEDVRESNQNRALLYIDKILSVCTDASIRNNSLSMACLWYSKLGRVEEAERLAKTLDGAMWTCGELLGRIYRGERQFKVIRDEMLRQFTSAIGELLDDLLTTKDDSGSNIYSDDEILELNQMCIDMLALYFPKGDYLYHAQYVEGAYRRMADIYASRNDAVKTIECLKSAAEFAIHFDNTSPDDTHISPAAKGIVSGELWWNDGHNSSYNLLQKLLNESNTQYNFVRNTNKYNEILTVLRTVAR
ncbi:MAG: helix-turn-helix transcriptional regulator [Clostridia bacterium]|nr:helix-turn-helix transcriptional regulator [Clostridia bacterium]